MLRAWNASSAPFFVVPRSTRSVRSLVVIKDCAEVFAVHSLAAHRAHQKPILAPLGFARAHICFDAVAEVGGKYVCHDLWITIACEFPSSYVGEITCALEA